MKLLLLFMYLLCGLIAMCTCTHHVTEAEVVAPPADVHVENTIQEETDEGDGDDDDDAVITSSNLSSNNKANGVVATSARTLYNGDTISIQIVHNMKLHIGCPHRTCGGKSCPGLYFDQAEYRHCWGEVFQIYRRYGRGRIRTGDYVGIYYPRGGLWLGTPHHQADLRSCPGRPPHPKLYIHKCGGEVFQIFARGKSWWQPINTLDYVMIYNSAIRTYLEYRFNNDRDTGLVRSNCPGHALPPSPGKFERCASNVFKIGKKY